MQDLEPNLSKAVLRKSAGLAVTNSDYFTRDVEQSGARLCQRIASVGRQAIFVWMQALMQARGFEPPLWTQWDPSWGCDLLTALACPSTTYQSSASDMDHHWVCSRHIP